MSFPLQEVQDILKVSFRNTNLLITAFTHRSYLNENRNWPLPHNDRLEFLGDAVLQLIATEALMRAAPDAPEGRMTEWRSRMVRTETLAHCVEKSNLHSFILMSKGQRKDTDRAARMIHACLMEAIIGALYLDQGLVAARRFAERFLFAHLDRDITDQRVLDPKSILQEKVQAKIRLTPTYSDISRTGPKHKSVFVVGVYFGDRQIAIGEGLSKKEAEQCAAAAALTLNGW